MDTKDAGLMSDAEYDPYQDVENALDEVRHEFISEIRTLKRSDDSPEESQKLYSAAREKYANRIRSIQNSYPDVFSEIQNRQEDSYTELLNSLVFKSNDDLPYDEELGDELQYLVTVPYGSEDAKGLDKSENMAGFATPSLDDLPEVMVSGGASNKDFTARHEGIHELTKGKAYELNGKKFGSEFVARSLDYLRNLVENDKDAAKATEDFVSAGSNNRYGGLTLLRLAFAAIPEMYKNGTFNKDKATKDTAKRVIEKIDEDEQGLIDSILGNAPEKVKEPELSVAGTHRMHTKASEGDIEDLKALISVLPFAEKQTEGNVSTDRYKIDRESIEMAKGGSMEPKPDYNAHGITSLEMLPAFITGTSEDITDSLHISRQFSEQNKFDDQDRTEDTMRHILMGGLVFGDAENDGVVEKGMRWIADNLIDVREYGNKDTPEGKVDLNNNEYGRQLRKLFPDREEFIEAVKTLATGMYAGEEMPPIEGKMPQLSYGNSGLDKQQGLMSEEESVQQ